MKKFSVILLTGLMATVLVEQALAQDVLPYDNGLATYHTAPRYRESESHPFRVLAYVVHPVGWLSRELIFRPLSYFASSTEETRSVMGYREPFDYRQPECFSADDSIPDCRAVSPFNYDSGPLVQDEQPVLRETVVREVYFPDVNFDFDVRKLNDLGKGQVRRIKAMLDKEPGVKVVLQGHTDYKGADGYNQKLGMDRSDAVRQELLALGVGQDRVSSVTFGKSQPIFSEQENWARAVNRRVQVQVDSSNPPAAAPVNAGGGEWKEAQ